jgi:hypothetical protein
MKGQAKSERPDRSTTGQGASDKDGLKSKSSAKPAEKPAERSTTGQAAKDSAKDKADTKASKKDETTGQASKDKTEKSTTGQGSSDTKASSGSKAPDTERCQAEPDDRFINTEQQHNRAIEHERTIAGWRAGQRAAAHDHSSVRAVGT